jgi:transposase-like protein
MNQYVTDLFLIKITINLLKLTVPFKGQSQPPRKITTDKLASYKAALRDLGCNTPVPGELLIIA